LTDANLANLDLSGVNLSDVNLSDSNLSGANLSGANLNGATLSGSDLLGATLGGVRSGGITGWSDSLPPNWTLVSGFLIGPGADLSGGDLTGASLVSLDLTNANLTGTDLNQANMTGAALSGITWSDTICPDTTNSDNDSDTCANDLDTDDIGAHDDLNTALVNAKAAYQQNSQSYPASALLVTQLAAAEPSLTFTTGPSSSHDQISVATSADGNAIVLSTRGEFSGDCWYTVDNMQSEFASFNAPWDQSSFMPGPPATGSGIPDQPGTWYGEWKHVTGNTPSCNADEPPTSSEGATVSFQSSGFPSL
jgi:hypothetical protein